MIITTSELDTFISSLGLTAPAAWTSGVKSARIEAAQRLMEQATGRRFDAVSEMRTFDGSGETWLLVDDLLSVTSLQVGSATLGTADYHLYPANALPKWLARRASGVWPTGRRNIAITGSWGYCATPPQDLKDACLMLATIALLSGKALQAEGESIGAVFQTIKAGHFTADLGERDNPIIAQITGWDDLIEKTLRAHARAWVM